MDGLEATRRIRADASLMQPRIIALTANVMQGDRERCLEAGADHYLSKPVKLEDLQSALADAPDGAGEAAPQLAGLAPGSLPLPGTA